MSALLALALLVSSPSQQFGPVTGIAGLSPMVASPSAAMPGLITASNPTIAALQSGKPRRLEIVFEGRVPVPMVGQIKAATATVVADLTGTTYAARSTAKSAGLVGWIVDYDLDINVQGQVTPAGLVTTSYSSVNSDGKKNRRVTMRNTGTAVTSASVPAWMDMGFPPATEEQKLEAVDPVTGIVSMALALGATPGNLCGNSVKVFDGRVRFDLKLSNGRRLQVKEKTWKGPAIQCDLEYVELAGGRQKSPEKRAADKADIAWLNITFAELSDGSRIPIKLEGRSKKRGKVTLTATRASFDALPIQKASAQTTQR